MTNSLFYTTDSTVDIDTRRDEIITALKNNACEVIFTKIDGSERIMDCTLVADALPKVEVNESKKTRAPNPTVISAFDLKKQEWRSFKIENVKSVTVLENA